MTFRKHVAVVFMMAVLLTMCQLSKGATNWHLYIEFSNTAVIVGTCGVGMTTEFRAQMIGSTGLCEEIDLVKAAPQGSIEGLLPGSKMTWAPPKFYCNASDPNRDTGRIRALRLTVDATIISAIAMDIVKMYKVVLFNDDISYTLFDTDQTQAHPEELALENYEGTKSITLFVPSGIDDEPKMNYAAFKFKKTSDTMMGEAIAKDYSYIRTKPLCAHACMEDGDCLAFRMTTTGNTCKLHTGYGAPVPAIDYYRLKSFGKVSGPASPVAT